MNVNVAKRCHMIINNMQIYMEKTLILKTYITKTFKIEK